MHCPLWTLSRGPEPLPFPPIVLKLIPCHAVTRLDPVEQPAERSVRQPWDVQLLLMSSLNHHPRDTTENAHPMPSASYLGSKPGFTCTRQTVGLHPYSFPSKQMVHVSPKTSICYLSQDFLPFFHKREGLHFQHLHITIFFVNIRCSVRAAARSSYIHLHVLPMHLFPIFCGTSRCYTCFLHPTVV
jgi:hypothetical protein